MVFKKQYFPETTIQSLATNQTVFNRGKELNKNSSIEDMKIDSESRTITFSVKEEEQQFTTQLRFYPNGVARNYHCSCGPFKKYSGACKHVVCSMLYLNTIKQNDLSNKNEGTTKTSNLSPKPQKPTARKSNIALNKLKEATSNTYYSEVNSVGKKPVHFEFVLNASVNQFNQYFEVYMKVGIDHLYVVKNIPHVILNLLEGNNYEFGKNFTYNPKDHLIYEEDKEVLETLYDIYNMVRSITRTGYEISYTNKNELQIPSQYLKSIAEKMSKTDGSFIRYDRPPQHLSKIDNLENIDIEKDFKEIPVTFKLTKEGSRFGFQIDNYEPGQMQMTLYSGANIIEYNHVLYFVTASEFQTIESLLATLREIQYQPIMMKGYELTEFISKVFPVISSLFPVSIDEDVRRLVFIKEMQPQVYLDYKNEALTIQPIFKYEDINVYPLRGQPVSESLDRILVRKVDEESKLLSLLKGYMNSYAIYEGYWQIESFEDISEFLYEGIANLNDDFEFYSTEEARKLIYQPQNTPSMSMEMNERSNLLEVSFNVEDMDDSDLSEIIRLLNQTNQSYYKLNNGQIVNLNKDEFKQIQDVTSKLDIDANNVQEEMSLPVYKGLSVLEDDHIDMGEQFKKMVSSLLEPDELEFTIPQELSGTLRPYQETGFKWLKSLDYYQFGGILADDMGLGKTIQTIAFILSKLQEKGGKYMIICPSSVLYNWEFEFNKFAPSISTILVSGSMDERKEQIKEHADDENIVWITSYPLIQRDFEIYKNVQFDTVVLDESQIVKNAAAKTTKAVYQIKSMNKFALSGTPIENNLDELWSLFSIIQPGLFSDKKSYRELEQQQIAQRIKPFVLRRLKGEVLDDLPPKTETTEYIDLSTEQKRLYQTQLSMIKKDVNGLIEEGQFDQNRMRVLAGMTRLRQICCDPRLITNSFEGDSAKLNRLFEYLKEARINGKRVVLFSQFTQMLDIIRDRLNQQQIEYHYLDGQTKKEDRLDLTTRFNQGEKDLFLISLKAGGTGLNLTGGDTVILYDSWWNPAIEDQAADRVHRFGQQKSVQVIRLISKGTIEEKINELQGKKRELIDSVIDSNNEQSISSLTKDEILGLLEME